MRVLCDYFLEFMEEREMVFVCLNLGRLTTAQISDKFKIMVGVQEGRKKCGEVLLRLPLDSAQKALQSPGTSNGKRRLQNKKGDMKS